MGMTQEDAGVLEVGGAELTEGAKFRFIEDVCEQLRLGSEFSVPFLTPCGPEIPPAPLGFPIPDLHDEETYADWHKWALGAYLSVAQTLNMPGQTPFLPIIFDPIHIAATLNLPMPSISLPKFPGLMLNLPRLMLKLEIMPPDIAAKLPDIMSLLEIPPAIPIPEIPEIPLPEIMADLPTLAINPILALPNIFVSLIGQFPVLAIDLLTLNLASICELALDAFAATNGPNPLLQIATTKVLAIRTGECLAIDLIGVTLGSASGGAVGAMGKEFGYEPPPFPGKHSEDGPRDKVVRFAETMEGTSYGNDDTREKYTMGLFPNLIYKNDGDPSYGDNADTDNGQRGEPGRPKQKALFAASGASSCGLFVRGALIAAGAKGDRFFTEPYREGTAISSLLRIAHERDAILFDKSRGDKEIPAFKKGDVVLIGSEGNSPHPLHVEMFLSDYGGGNSGDAPGIGGGAPDPENKGADGKLVGSAIKRVTYKFEKKTQDGYYNHPFAGPEDGPTDASDDPTGTSYRRPVLVVIDVEKIISYGSEEEA